MLRRCKSYRASPPDGGLEAETSQKTLKQTLIPAGQRRLPAHTTAGTDTRIGNTHTHTHTEGSCSACSPLGPISVKHFSLPPSTLPPLLFLSPRFLARGYGTAEQSTRRQAGTRVPGAIWPPGRCAGGWLLLLCSTDLTPQSCPSFSFKEKTLAHACKSKLRMRSPAQGSQDYFQLLLCIPMRAPPPSRPATSAFRTSCSPMPQQPPLGSLIRSGQPGKGCPPPPEPFSHTSAFHPFCLRRRVALPFRGASKFSPPPAALTSTPCPPSTPAGPTGAPPLRRRRRRLRERLRQVAAGPVPSLPPPARGARGRLPPAACSERGGAGRSGASRPRIPGGSRGSPSRREKRERAKKNGVLEGVGGSSACPGGLGQRESCRD